MNSYKQLSFLTDDDRRRIIKSNLIISDTRYQRVLEASLLAELMVREYPEITNPYERASIIFNFSTPKYFYYLRSYYRKKGML